MKTVTEVIASLNALSEYGIYKLFVEEGVKGRRHATCYCPVANYVRAETGAFVQMGLYTLNDLESIAPRSYEVGQSVSDFIASFDQGEYDDLLG